MENKDYSALLEKMSDISARNDEIQAERKKRGDFFNVFDVLKVDTDEVKFSSFIAELLNPNGSHGLGDAFLNIFCKQIIGLEDIQTDETNVSTEFDVGYINKDKTVGGRLDIYVDTKRNNKDFGIIIENKVYATDQENQLIRYKNFADKKYKDGKNYKILYLTLNGHNPSKDSVGTINDKDAFWTNISYRTEIKNWIQKCVEISARQPLVRETLIQFVNLINKLTYQEIDKTMSDEIVKLLLEPNNMKFAREMFSKIEDAKDEFVLKYFIPMFIKELEDDENLIVWKAEKNEIRSYENPLILIKKEHWENKEKQIDKKIRIQIYFNNTQKFEGLVIDTGFEYNKIAQFLTNYKNDKQNNDVIWKIPINEYKNWNDQVFQELINDKGEKLKNIIKEKYIPMIKDIINAIDKLVEQSQYT